MPRRLYLLRHGQTEVNALNIIQGQLLNYPLNNYGTMQSELAAEVLSEVVFNRIYISPALRAKETAIKILESQKSDVLVEINSNIVEINFGILEGETFNEAEKLHPNLMKTYWRKPSQCAFPEGESLTQAKERIGQVVEAVIAKSDPNENILIVSHGGVMSLILICLFNLDMDAMFHAFRHNNCGLSIIEWQSIGQKLPNYRPKIICLNDISYLGEEYTARLKG